MIDLITETERYNLRLQEIVEQIRNKCYTIQFDLVESNTLLAIRNNYKEDINLDPKQLPEYFNSETYLGLVVQPPLYIAEVNEIGIGLNHFDTFKLNKLLTSSSDKSNSDKYHVVYYVFELTLNSVELVQICIETNPSDIQSTFVSIESDQLINGTDFKINNLSVLFDRINPIYEFEEKL